MGYRTEVVEFISPEHTARNLMIRAVRGAPKGEPALVNEYLELRRFWGVTPYIGWRWSWAKAFRGSSVPIGNRLIGSRCNAFGVKIHARLAALAAREYAGVRRRDGLCELFNSLWRKGNPCGLAALAARGDARGGRSRCARDPGVAAQRAHPNRRLMQPKRTPEKRLPWLTGHGFLPGTDLHCTCLRCDSATRGRERVAAPCWWLLKRWMLAKWLLRLFGNV